MTRRRLAVTLSFLSITLAAYAPFSIFLLPLLVDPIEDMAVNITSLASTLGLAAAPAAMISGGAALLLSRRGSLGGPTGALAWLGLSLGALETCWFAVAIGLIQLYAWRAI